MRFVSYDCFVFLYSNQRKDLRIIESKRSCVQLISCCKRALIKLDLSDKGPVKLIQRVKIALSFLHALSNLFHQLSFSAWLSSSTSDRERIFRNPLLKLEIHRFFIHSYFQLTLKVGLSIQLNCRPTLKNDLFFVW